MAFVRCLKQLSARCGTPQKLCSDNSKTFRSANKIISFILDMPEVQQHFKDVHVRIQWAFIFEKTPWWGVYEKMIKSMKGCLRKVIGKARMSYDEPHTVLVEVEAMLNSRPITYLSSRDGGTSHTLSFIVRSPSVHPATYSKDPEFEGTNAMIDLSRRMWHPNQILEHFWK